MRTLTASRARLGSTAALLGALLAACSSGSPRPEPAPLSPVQATVEASRVWSAKLGPVSFPLQVHVQGTRVTLASDDGLVAEFDAESGRQNWRVALGAPLTAGVGSDGQTSAVVTRNNEVIALAEGREIWRHKLDTQSYTAPLVAGGRVFVLGADRSITALDARSGGSLWQIGRAHV